jgi:hypothetical protein
VALTATNTRNPTQFYGFCDIGYFRNRPNDTNIGELKNKFPNKDKLLMLNPCKIHYALVDDRYVSLIRNILLDKDPKTGMPRIQLPANQNSIGGGFFVVGSADAAIWWSRRFEQRLKDYFDNGYLVKDDQLILADIIFSDTEKRFQLWRDVQSGSKIYDPWFLMSRILL